MRTSKLAGTALAVGVFCLLVAGGIGGTGSAQAAVPSVRPAVTSFSILGNLNGVAAASASAAWAVGGAVGCGNQCTLLLQWNGTRWTQVKSPRPVSGMLNAVYAASEDDVWAVGCTVNGDQPGNVLVMHWNGRAWSWQKDVPDVPGCLLSVAGSGNNVWAVGGTAGFHGGDYLPLVLHRTGNRWYLVPTAVSEVNLNTVVATGANTAWAGGQGNAYPLDSVLLRWSGAMWQPVSFPLEGLEYYLSAIAVGPSGTMLAVGYRYHHGSVIVPYGISMRWNGKTWETVAVPYPKDRSLSAVAFIPGGTAWAVGGVGPNDINNTTLILRWTGTAWVRVWSPNVDRNGALAGVAATSASNAWAVGEYIASTNGDPYTLILHWNGKSWN